MDNRLTTGRRAGLNPTFFVAQPHGLPHHEKLARGLLLDDARLLDRRDEGLRRTIAAGHFRLIDPDLAVIDAHAGQGRHDVFDHLDRCPAGAKYGPPRHLDAIGDRGRNAGTPRQIGAHEHDPLPRPGRTELDADIASTPIADPFDRRDGR